MKKDCQMHVLHSINIVDFTYKKKTNAFIAPLLFACLALHCSPAPSLSICLYLVSTLSGAFRGRTIYFYKIERPFKMK